MIVGLVETEDVSGREGEFPVHLRRLDAYRHLAAHQTHLRLGILLIGFEVELRAEHLHLQPVGGDDERAVLVAADVGEHLARQVDLPHRAVELLGIDEFRTGVEPHVRAVGQHDLAALAHAGIDLHPLARGVGLMPVMERQNDGGNGGGVFDYTEGPPPPPEVTAAGGGIRGGACREDRVQLTPHALLALGIVLGLGSVQQVAEQLVQPRVLQPLPQPHAHLLRLGFRAVVPHVGKQLFTRHIFLGIHRFRLVFRRTAQKRASRRRSSCGSA